MHKTKFAVHWHLVSLTVGILAVAAGCGGPYELAPVSGVVTLDGEPLAAARVRFEPRAGGDSVDAGPGSIGVTDDEGRFELETIKRDKGAVVGKHTVRIGTRQTRLDPNNLDRLEVLAKEVVPMRYNTSTQLTFEVPSEGTEGANFDLSGKGRKVQ